MALIAQKRTKLPKLPKATLGGYVKTAMALSGQRESL